MKILVTGSNGQLGREFQNILNKHNYNFIFEDFDILDITNINDVEKSIKKNKPQLIINCAAYTNVAKAETERKLCYNVNVQGVKNLVTECEKYFIKLIHFSTDYVYDGKSLQKIKENENLNPLNYYGRTKRMGEQLIENSKSESIVIRTSWLYSNYGNNFVKTIIKKSKENESLKIVDDEFGSPTFAKDLANAVLSIISSKIKLDKVSKVYNYSNLGSTSWFDFARKILEILKIDCKIISINSKDLESKISRPKYSIMDKSLIKKTFGVEIKDWEKSLKHFLLKDFKS